MTANYCPQPPQEDIPVEPRRPLIASVLMDSRLFPGWGPRI